MRIPPLPLWICPDCGYEMRFGITRSTVEVSVATMCPSCRSEMFRDDPLGQIEQEAHRG